MDARHAATDKGCKAMRRNTLLLLACVLLLAVLCCLSVDAPIRFEKEQAQRELVVKQHLLQVRAAQERYFLARKNYCPSLGQLVKQGFLADSLQFIPFTDRQPWRLSVSVVALPSGRTKASIECGARYEDFLQGLDKEATANLAASAESQGRYPGLCFGNLQKPENMDCNW